MACWAFLKASQSSSVHRIASCDWRPPVTLSSGARCEEHCGITHDKTLYALMKDLI